MKCLEIMTKYSLEYSKTFKKSLSKIDKKFKTQIETAIKKLETEYENCNVVKITGFIDTYRLRVGDYSVLFDKYDDKLVIFLLDVKHRKDVYRNL